MQKGVVIHAPSLGERRPLYYKELSQLLVALSRLRGMLRETKGSVMTDDPVEILRAAGVECAELDTFLRGRGPSEWEDDDELDAAILALARLVAKYKWQRDEAAHVIASFEPIVMLQAARGHDVSNEAAPEQDAKAIGEIDRRWKEHNG